MGAEQWAAETRQVQLPSAAEMLRNPPPFLHSAPRGFLQGSASFPAATGAAHAAGAQHCPQGQRGTGRQRAAGKKLALACLMLHSHVGCGTEFLLVLLQYLFHQKTEFLVRPKAGQWVCSLAVLLVGLLSPSPPLVSSVPDSQTFLKAADPPGQPGSFCRPFSSLCSLHEVHSPIVLSRCAISGQHCPVPAACPAALCPLLP